MCSSKWSKSLVCVCVCALRQGLALLGTLLDALGIVVSFHDGNLAQVVLSGAQATQSGLKLSGSNIRTCKTLSHRAIAA